MFLLHRLKASILPAGVSVICHNKPFKKRAPPSDRVGVSPLMDGWVHRSILTRYHLIDLY